MQELAGTWRNQESYIFIFMKLAKEIKYLYFCMEKKKISRIYNVFSDIVNINTYLINVLYKECKIKSMHGWSSYVLLIFKPRLYIAVILFKKK